MPKGSKVKNAVLNEVQVTVIKELINDGVALREIMVAFNVNRNTLAAISAGNSWKHIDPKATASRGRLDKHRFKEGYAEKLEGIKWTEQVK